MGVRWSVVVMTTVLLVAGCAPLSGGGTGPTEGAEARSDGRSGPRNALDAAPGSAAQREDSAAPGGTFDRGARSTARASRASAAAPEGTPPRGSDAWRMRRPSTDGQIEAYATQMSATPGTRVGLKVSTSERTWTARAFRIGSYRGGWGHQVWQSGPQPGSRQPAARFAAPETRTVVAPWRTSIRVDTDGWAPGLYVFRLSTGTGWDAQVPYVVTSPSTRGTVALVAPVTTWQAYNSWGGYSLYEGPSGDRRSWAVSFDRPWHGVWGMNDFRTAVVPIVVLAERSGTPLSYLTSIDLHQDAGALAGARGLVSMGHDEYWTTAMRRHVLAARDAGTNLAFLGANTMYWRVRLDERRPGHDRLPRRRLPGPAA